MGELKITRMTALPSQNPRLLGIGAYTVWWCQFFLVHDPSTRLVFLFDGGLAAELHGSRLSVLRPAARWYGDIATAPAPCASPHMNHGPAPCVLRPGTIAP